MALKDCPLLRTSTLVLDYEGKQGVPVVFTAFVTNLTFHLDFSPLCLRNFLVSRLALALCASAKLGTPPFSSAPFSAASVSEVFRSHERSPPRILRVPQRPRVHDRGLGGAFQASRHGEETPAQQERRAGGPHAAEAARSGESFPCEGLEVAFFTLFWSSDALTVLPIWHC
eukprot:scaffold140_cov247-Pinguiococcus_pyrenoidosus.AAC.14